MVILKVFEATALGPWYKFAACYAWEISLSKSQFRQKADELQVQPKLNESQGHTETSLKMKNIVVSTITPNLKESDSSTCICMPTVIFVFYHINFNGLLCMNSLWVTPNIKFYTTLPEQSASNTKH